MRLWVKLAATLAAVGLVPLLILGFFLANTIQQREVKRVELEVYQDATLQADLLGRSFVDQARFLEGWTALYPSTLLVSGPALQEGLIRAVYLATPNAAVVVLVDADGVAVVTPQFSETSPERPANMARAQMLVRRLPLSQALLGGMVVGAPYLPSGSDGVPSVPIAVSTVPPGPDAAGLVLGAEIRLELVAQLVRTATAEQGYVLIDADGNLLVGAEHPLVQADLLRPLIAVNADLNFRYTRGDGVEVIGAVAQVVGTDWVLATVRSADVLALPAQEVRSQVAPILAFSVALALFLGWNLSMYVSVPVEALRNSVLKVAEGDYGRRTTIRRTDEIGELGSAFNLMSAKLQVNRREIEEQHQQIVAFNTQLQERVERRTAELRDAQAQLVRSGQLAAVAEVGAGLAHELNNPLAGILGISQVLKARASDTDAALLADIETQTQRCSEVVEAMLRFASGELDPAGAPVVDLRDVLGNVVKLVQGPFRQRGVHLILEMPDTPLRVRVDPIHASRIFAQVLNALRAGLTHGATLTVVGSLLDEEVEVVFKPDSVVAVDEFRRDDWMASGMGMWGARQLLDQLGGRLEQPMKLPMTLGMAAPVTEEIQDPSIPLLLDATWRVFLPAS